MSRLHIHLANSVLCESIRPCCDVFVFIDLPKALEDGILFFKSRNKVILTPGNEDGFILPAYFEKITDAHGNILWSCEFI